MRRRLLVLVTCALAWPGSASAATVLVLNPHGGAIRRVDPYLPASGGASERPARASVRRRPHRAAIAHVAATAAPKRKRPAPPPVTLPGTLDKLVRSGALSQSAEQGYLQEWYAALSAEHHLSGTRLAELSAISIELHDFAVAGLLTPSRLPALFLMLERNREWWTTGPLLSSGDRVEFPGSGIVWEYYPGRGIQLQVLGTFGRADGLYTAGPSQYGALRALVDEMLPLAATRGGASAWEYYFSFDGGSPPWTSAMAQATGIEALTRAAAAAKSVGDSTAASGYYADAESALGLFSLAPPAGVTLRTGGGNWYLLYSFAPGATVINGFLQTLIGLYDYAAASGSTRARALFDAGNAVAQAQLPAYDTGAWSLYQPGQEDDLSYHELVTGFLQQLCARTSAAAYCTTAQHFSDYLKTPPALTLDTARLRAGSAAPLYFGLSKYSHVGVVVARGSQTLFSTSAEFSHGTQAFTLPAFGQAGTYTVRIAATDLAGNFSRIVESLTVLPKPKPKPKPKRK